MPILTALRPLTGDWGFATEGQSFLTDEETAEDLEARGLAERPRVKMAPPYENKMLAALVNKKRA